MLQDYIQQYKAAATEFEESRARARRDVAKEVERGKRAILVDLLEVVDNLDRAIESRKEARTVDVLLHGVEMVRQQFLQRLEGFGIHPIEPLHQPFDPALHEAITVVPGDAIGRRREGARRRCGADTGSATRCCGPRRSRSGGGELTRECTMHDAGCTMHKRRCPCSRARCTCTRCSR